MPKNAVMPSAIAITPIVKLRLRNSERSTTGCSSVSSHATKNVMQTSAMMPSVVIIGEENQSLSLPLSSMNCRQPTPTISSTSPMTSIGAFTVTDSRLLSSTQVMTRSEERRVGKEGSCGGGLCDEVEDG